MISFSPDERDLFYDVRSQMHDDLRRRALQHWSARDARRAAIGTVEEMRAHESAWRARLLDSIGGLPVERCALRERVTAVTETEHFRVERLVFQSLPGFYVTAACYVPHNLAGPAPAVLLLQGHVDKPWPAYQRLCGDLAAAGFITLMIDPVSQGERSQYFADGRFNLMSVNNEHNQAGSALFLCGESLARYETWDAVRALDYLQSRPDVDGERLAATGHSGGGWQTLLLMALDDRLAAAAPCAIVTTHDWIMKCAQPVDAEHLLFGAYRDGPDYDDLLTVLAPKPVLALATSYDRYFPIEGTLSAAAWARRVYAIHGAAENFELVVDDDVHEYTRPLREACVGFFRHHLLDGDRNFREADSPSLTLPQMLTTSSGQVQDEYPDAKIVTQLALAAPEQPTSRVPSELRAKLGEVLGINAAGCRKAPIYPRLARGIEHDGYPLEKLLFFSAPDIMCTAVVCHPRGTAPEEKLPAVLFLGEGGTTEGASHRSRWEMHLERGRRVVILDVRGFGAVRARGRVSAYLEQSRWTFLNNEWNSAGDAMQLGLSMLGLRVFDVLRCLDYLVTRPDMGEISLHGVGASALWAYFAAALDERWSGVICEEMLCSYRLLVETPLYDNARYALPNLPWGLLRHFDLPDLLPCFGRTPIRLLEPRDAKGRPASLALMDSLYPDTGSNFVIEPGPQWTDCQRGAA